jgi:hypothetical protein
VRPPSSPVSYITRDKTNKDNLKETPPTPSKGDVEVFGKFVQLKKEELVDLADQFGRVKVLEVIDEINDYLASTGKKPYKDYAATIRNWMRRRKKENDSKGYSVSFETIQEEVKKRADFLIKKNHIVIGYDYIEFINGILCTRLKATENSFMEQLENNLRKFNIETSWLKEVQ